MNTEHKDKTELVLKQVEAENLWFENHWLWRKLNITPEEFFKKLRKLTDHYSKAIPNWDQMVEHAKKRHHDMLKKEKNKKINKLNSTSNGIQG